MIRDWLANQWAKRRSVTSRRVPGKKKSRSCPLQVELLEDRTVPSAVGPEPIPSSYPLQPGFTPITSISQITGPGKYQLTANDDTPTNGSTSAIYLNDVTLDGGGYSIAGDLDITGSQDVVKNCQVTGVIISGSDYVLSNNWMHFGISGGFVLDSGSYGTFSNNLFDGVAAGDVDDLLLLSGAGSGVSNVAVTNNVFENCYDCGIEGTGSWNQCTFTGNVFSNTQFCAIGGWYITGYGSPYTFYMTNCTFQNNQLDSGRLFEFTNGKGGLMSALDDASATSSWGNGPVYYGNTFSGDSVARSPVPRRPAA